MPKVSVILPSLNVAGYIRECIESVVNQTLSDIEILCIDAGSTDGTCEIIKEYADRDSRIRLIHSDRKSYGYQINLGMDMAEGEYLGIVETDDCVEPDMYEVLYKTAIENNLDYAKAGFFTLVTPYEEEGYLLESPLKDADRIISYQYFMEQPVSPDVYIWNGVYKLSFLRDFHVRLNESVGAAFQDCGFRYLVDMNLRRGMFLDQFFYKYRRDNTSSSVYNPNFARFNLAECNYVRKRMEKDGINDRERRAFMARETVRMALSPYLTYRGYGEPDEENLSALDEFRRIMIQDREDGLLTQDEMLKERWIEMRLFTEKPKAHKEYIAIKAETNYGVYKDFIYEMAKKKQIIVFCAGKMAKFALCLMRINKLENIVAFCDNSSERWGGRYMGYEILPPKEAVRRFPNAHYLIANKKSPEEIVNQLLDQGIGKENMTVYKLPMNALESTSLFLRGLQ